jgi:hypothetical protein
MKSHKTKTGILFLTLLIILTLAATTQAQTYNITWWTVDSGGGTSTGSNYSLSGTIGQPDAGIMTGGGYTLAGGFWGPDQLRMIYLPLIMKN